MLPGIALMGAMALGGTAGSFWAEISDEFITKTGSTTGGSKTLVTSAVFVTAHGGIPGYTYGWVRTSGSALITATAPSASSTTFTATLSANQEVSATFTCTVTDSTGAFQTVSVEVTIELTSFA
jgi:hypothetical protein